MLKLLASAAVFTANASPLFIPAPVAATLPYLKAATLQTLDGEKRTFKAEELWENNGALIYATRKAGCQLCRSAATKLSMLKPELEKRGMNMYAVVHEEIHAEKFDQYFKGDIFLDVDKIFYGPELRHQPSAAFFSVMCAYFTFKSMNSQIPAEKDGYAKLLGATFVIGPGEQGVIFQHNEFLAGNEADIELIRKNLELVESVD